MADLLAQNRYDNYLADLDRSHNYKIQVAQREHYELASTIRQRLINSVTKKRDRLLREKEQMDIADSNSMFLHPSNFSLNVPASPGGIHSNRKTRHTRHRLGDVAEDLANERGRKRKAPADDEGNESPVPTFRSLGNDTYGGNSPYHDQRAKTLYAQQEAPAYSIERIFTEKELAHATNLAQFATQKFFLEQQHEHENGGPGLLNGHAPPSIPSIDGSAEVTIAATLPIAEGEEPIGGIPSIPSITSPPPSQNVAVDMERTISYHATRGATKANPLSFLSEAAEALSSAPPLTNPNRFLPVIVPITKTDKGAPTPQSMRIEDVADDLSLMFAEDDHSSKRGTNGYADDDDNINSMRTKYLEQACREPIGSQPFRLPLTEVGPAMIKEGVARPAHFGFADPSSFPNGVKEGVPAPASNANLHSLASVLRGGEPMSRATSMGGSEMGANDVGGTSMRRTRSRLV